MYCIYSVLCISSSWQTHLVRYVCPICGSNISNTHQKQNHIMRPYCLTHLDLPPSSRLRWPRLRLPTGSTGSVAFPEGIGNSSLLESALRRGLAGRDPDAGFGVSPFPADFRQSTFWFINSCRLISSTDRERSALLNCSSSDVSLSSRASIACELPLDSGGFPRASLHPPKNDCDSSVSPSRGLDISLLRFTP